MKHNKMGECSNKLILRRKIRSTLSISRSGGRNKQIQIEVRKKRTYVHCADVQEVVNIDVKNKISACNNNDAVSKDAAVIQSQLFVDEKKNRSTNLSLSSSPLSSKKSLKQADISTEFVAFSKIKSKHEINCVAETIIKKTKNKIHVFSQKKKEFDQQQCVEVIDNNINNKLRYSPILDKNNDRKLDSERRNRSRLRARYKSGGNSKLIKRKRNNSYRLYDVSVSTVSDESENSCEQRDQLCITNRINKSKHKHSNSTLVQSFNKPVHTIIYDIVIGKTISVSELANKMSMKSAYVIKVMMKLGFMVTINEIIDQETAQLVVEEMGHNVVLRHENALEESIMQDRISNNIKDNNFALLKNRAPIVTVMGHVNHGKTSLLDYIRSTKVAASEIGGITQSIGAYHVNVNDDMITFIDTPGHAAFTAMRIRGVQLTDIVVLVVAADDGVMPQTVEAIQHIKIAKVPIVVAINKIDKLEVNSEHIKNELSKYGLIAEEWGGDVQFVNVSAISGLGIDNLLDAILLQSEILELKVAHHGMANAVVIDACIDRGRGPVVTVLVREGTLKCGDIVLCGAEYGRIRAMRDECGCNVGAVGPSMPVELLGLSGTPVAGEIAVVVRDEKKAREVALYRQSKFREVKLARREKVSNLENVFVDGKSNSNVIPELHLIVKASTQGFVEAIHDALLSLSSNEIIVNIVSSSIGGITETDVVLAVTSSAIILGFNVRADLSARRIIESEGLDVRYYTVIYELLHGVKQVIKSILIPKYKCEVIGLAEVRNVFCSPKYGNIAGCMVIEGMIKRYKKIRVIRNSIVVYDGELESLRRFKNDVHEVKSGVECGIGIKNYDDISSGDIIEVFDFVKTPHVSSEVKKI